MHAITALAGGPWIYMDSASVSNWPSYGGTLQSTGISFVYLMGASKFHESWDIMGQPFGFQRTCKWPADLR